MPELPEVETIARGLDAQVQGLRVMTACLYTPSVLHAGTVDTLPGARILQVTRRAKLLLMALDTGLYLVIHLKMTGRVWLGKPTQALPKHTHLVLGLDNGEQIVFEDARRFGYCRVETQASLAAWPFYASLGPEPLAVSAQDLARIMTGRRARIKALLLDQTCMAGVGNIYADEALFAAEIHPATQAIHISSEQLLRLCTELQRILALAIKAGGSTISDYRNAYGRSGIFQNSFAVYGKKGAACPRCSHTLVAIQVAGRTSTHCPHCQALEVARKPACHSRSDMP